MAHTPPSSSSSPPAPTSDSSRRIRDMLFHLRETVQQSINDIEQIAALEAQRHGDDTLEGIAWCEFGDGLHSDVAHAARTIEWQIAALRGSLIYRGLDSSQQDDAEVSRLRNA